MFARVGLRRERGWGKRRVVAGAPEERRNEGGAGGPLVIVARGRRSGRGPGADGPATAKRAAPGGGRRADGEPADGPEIGK